MANDLLVRIFGDNRQLLRTFEQSAAATTSFGRSVQTTGTKLDKTTKSLRGFAAGSAAGFAGAVAFAEVTQQIRAAIDVASNLQEQMSKTNVVFGESADQVEAWSKTTAEGIGVARDEALAAASTFGAMFDQAGQSASDAAGLSQAVVQLAADLASFNNTSIEESLTALRSGLSGEIEPLRRFQVFLTEASVAAEAMAKSGKATSKELTQGEKIMARWNLILQQTSKQQGDFARTSSGLANQQRILAAQTRDLQANLGNLLLPVMTKLVENLNKATAGALALGDALTVLGNVKIPVINIPIKTTVVGAKDIPGFNEEFGKNLLPPQLRGALPFIKAIQDALTPDKVPDTAAAADAFVKDTGIGAFIQNLPKEVQKVVKGAISFGEKGFKAVENDLGESLQRQFDGLVDALQLKFDKAKLTKGTADELGVLREIEKAINARIKTQGRTTDLLRMLFEVQQQRQAILDGIAADKLTEQQAALDAFFGNLQLRVSKAELTPTLRDDIDRLVELRDALRKQIKAGGDVLAYQEQLISVESQIASLRRQREENQRNALRNATQAKQFRALGLSETGDEIVPGLENLQKRISGALRRIGTGDLDVSSKLVSRLKLAQKLIRTEGGKVTKETRSWINDMLNALTKGADKIEGPLTKTTSLNANKVLDGLGLGRDMEKELRARLSSFNSAGRALAGARAPTGGFRGGAVVVESYTTVQLDQDVVGRAVTRSQQKTGRRNPKQKRGPNSGI